MIDENDKRIRLFEKNLPDFVQKVDPIELLPYLHCLTRSSKEEITNKQVQCSRHQAACLLHQHLIRMDDWCETLQNALRRTQQEQLADKLCFIDRKRSKPSKTLSSPKMSTSSEKKITGKNLFGDLPYSVTQTLKILDSDQVESNWKALGAELGYTWHDINRIECNKNQPSPTEKLLADWSQTCQSPTLHTLLCGLKAIGRVDLLREVQQITGYKLNPSEDCKTPGDVPCHVQNLDTCQSTNLGNLEMNRETCPAIETTKCPLDNHEISCHEACSEINKNWKTRDSGKKTGVTDVKDLRNLDTGYSQECSLHLCTEKSCKNAKTSTAKGTGQECLAIKIDQTDTPFLPENDGCDNERTLSFETSSSTSAIHSEVSMSRDVNINDKTDEKSFRDKVIQCIPLVVGIGALMAVNTFRKV